jgi:SpoVK/Ycf46/Vps4 family AAA+-type ATPase
MHHLQEICSHLRHRHTVYFKWGFANRFALGRGLNILFSGSSGTGKTMAADIIASEFNLDLYQIDLSAIVSKYIGETEKNLSRIFKEASSGNLILFFDEADALFGKRSEVKDAHDRYANIEIDYLLQKMEDHEGIVILATNLSKNIDEAFLRRLHFSLEFPFPDENQRLLIWKKIFPPETPIEVDIDFPFLAERFSLSGGNIKNVAMTAAFYAAEDESAVKMPHIILALKRELQKMGKLCVKADFGRHYAVLERAMSDG